MIKCKGKIKYLTEEAAELRIDKMRNDNDLKKEETDKLTSYRCKYCGFYHVGRDRYLRNIK